MWIRESDDFLITLSNREVPINRPFG